MLKPWLYEGITEAGTDEAGRGCLAGPVVAAAVILPPDYKNELLNDSKKLSEKKREQLREVILREALSYGTGIVSPAEIDKLNILNASFLAMHRALDQLKIKPGHVLVDGNRFRQWRDVPFTTIVKGDGKMMSIAAASILAKTTRDHLMKELHKEYPVYGWANNKGYPTRQHIAGIDRAGYSPHHRRSFHLKRQLKLDF